MIDRWEDIATYFEIPMPDQVKFKQGHEPKNTLDWLEQRDKLPLLRDAFHYLECDDLVDILNQNKAGSHKTVVPAQTAQLSKEAAGSASL